jgi:hypothetical protein
VLVSAVGPVCSRPPGDVQSHQRTHCCLTAWPAVHQHCVVAKTKTGPWKHVQCAPNLVAQT